MNKKVFTDIGFNTVIKFAVRLRGVVLITIMTSSVGIASYGAYVQLISLATLLALIFEFSLHGALIQYADSDQYSINKLYYSTAIPAVLSGCIAAVSLLLFNTTLSKILLNSAQYSQIFVYGSIFVPVRILENMLKSYFRSLRKIKIFSLMQATRAYSTILGIVLAIFVLDLNIELIVLTVVLIELAYVVLIQMYVITQIGVTSPSLQILRHSLKYCLPLAASDIANRITERADRFLIGAMVGASAVGIYSVAYRIGTVITMYSVPIITSYFPEFSRLLRENQYEKVQNFMKNGVTYFILLSIPTVTGMIMLGPQIVRFITMTDSTRQSGLLLPIIGIGLTFWGLDQIYGIILIASERTGLISKLRALSAVLNIILNLMLIPRFGVFGAAGATVASYFTSSYLIYKYSNRVVSSKIPSVTILRSTVAAGCMYLFGKIILDIGLIFTILSSAGLYFLLLVIMREIKLVRIVKTAFQ